MKTIPTNEQLRAIDAYESERRKARHRAPQTSQRPTPIELCALTLFVLTFAIVLPLLAGWLGELVSGV